MVMNMNKIRKIVDKVCVFVDIFIDYNEYFKSLVNFSCKI